MAPLTCPFSKNRLNVFGIEGTIVEGVAPVIVLDDGIRSLFDKESNQRYVRLRTRLASEHQRRNPALIAQVDFRTLLHQHPGAMQAGVCAREAVVKGISSIVVVYVHPGEGATDKARDGRASPVLAGVHEGRLPMRVPQVNATAKRN